jgi:phage shock protein C
MAYKRLYRSEKDRMIAGVCGGLGEYFEVDPVIVRLIFIFVGMAGGSGLLIYLVLWLIVPLESEVKSEVKKEQSDVIAANTKEMKETAKRTAEAVRSALKNENN